MNQNNLAQEIIIGIIAGLLVIGGVALFYIGKIDFSGAMGMWALAGGVVGFKLALNAPSPSQQVQIGTQQNQLNAQQASLQQLISYALGMPPGLVQSLAPQPIPTQVLQTVRPTEVATPPVAPQAMLSSAAVVQNPNVPAQQQFKAPSPLPQVEVPMAQQFSTPIPVTPVPILSQDSMPLAALNKVQLQQLPQQQ